MEEAETRTSVFFGKQTVSLVKVPRDHSSVAVSFAKAATIIRQ